MMRPVRTRYTPILASLFVVAIVSRLGVGSGLIEVDHLHICEHRAPQLADELERPMILIVSASTELRE